MLFYVVESQWVILLSIKYKFLQFQYVNKAPVDQLKVTASKTLPDDKNGLGKQATHAVPLAVPVIVPPTALDPKALVNEISKTISLAADSKGPNKPKDEVVASITSLPGFSRLIYHYLMLSKIRLTCEYPVENVFTFTIFTNR